MFVGERGSKFKIKLLTSFKKKKKKEIFIYITILF